MIRLPWLRCRMSYHRLPNLAERFHGVLTEKLTKVLASTTHRDDDLCNCPAGHCVMKGAEGKCRQRNVVYSITCKFCDRVYIGNTSNHLKTRVNNHLQNVRMCIRAKSPNNPPVNPPPPGDPPDVQDDEMGRMMGTLLRRT